jgi:hypothetical protein
MQFNKEASQTRDYCVAKTRRNARLAQIPFDFALGRLSPRKERLFGMTIKLTATQLPASFTALPCPANIICSCGTPVNF